MIKKICKSDSNELNILNLQNQANQWEIAKVMAPFLGPGPCQSIQFLNEVSDAKDTVLGTLEVMGIFDNI